MTDGTTPPSKGWFEDLDPEAIDSAAESILVGEAEEPRDWPAIAVEDGYAASEGEYYERLHDAALRAVRTEVRKHERAGDRQLIHGIRAMDDCAGTANELAERLSEWAGGYYDETGTGIEYARRVAGRERSTAAEERIVSLAERVVGLADERDALAAFVEREAPRVAPNLSALAGPTLSARLIALAGGLGALAKKPSGTVQVLGAEDALFAHLRGGSPSPKHGIIYTHEYVRGTRPEERGSAARALAGKLSIAARVDHYSGERKPELDEELDRRIERIRSRGGG